MLLPPASGVMNCEHHRLPLPDPGSGGVLFLVLARDAVIIAAIYIMEYAR